MSFFTDGMLSAEFWGFREPGRVYLQGAARYQCSETAPRRLAGIRWKDWACLLYAGETGKMSLEHGCAHISDSPSWSRPRSDRDRSFAPIRPATKCPRLAREPQRRRRLGVRAGSGSRRRLSDSAAPSKRTPGVVRIITVPGIPGAGMAVTGTRLGGTTRMCRYMTITVTSK